MGNDLHQPAGSRARRRHAPIRFRVFCLVLVAAGLPALSWGQEPDRKIELHGFGGWAYGETDGNRYLLADGEGNYDTAELSLNVTANPYDRLWVVAQVHLERDRDDETVELDYGFVEWRFSDALRLRFGRVKHPYGLYGETYDLGTIRPFYLLPQSVYGKVGTTSKNYNGVGLRGTRFFDRWELQYDLYFGQLQNAVQFQRFDITADDFEPTSELTSTVEDAVGTRLHFVTPVNGLSFGVSGYYGEQGLDFVLEALGFEGYRRNYGAHLEYNADRWLLRAEYANLVIEDFVDYDSYYLELGYHLTDHWQVAARFDSFESKRLTGGPAGGPEWLRQIQRSEDLGFALNYWFRPDFVLRLNYHQVDGNRFAFPDTPDEILGVLINDNLDTETDVLIFGAHFSF